MAMVMLREISVQFGDREHEFSPKMPHMGYAVAMAREIVTDDAVESVLAIFLDGTARPCGYDVVAKGGGNSVFLDVGHIFEKMLSCYGRQLILLHNHPSGDPTPSSEDYALTGKVEEACDLLHRTFIDHVVWTRHNGWYSIKQQKRVT